MRFEINRLEMVEAAKNAAKVVPARAPVDILNGVLVEGNDNTAEVFMTATNFEMSIQLKTKASVAESGSMLVNPRLLVDMLSLLSGEFVIFSADRTDVLRVIGGKCAYEIKCLLARHYPKPIMPFPEDTVKVSGICSLSRRTVFAVSKEEHKPALQCVNVKLTQNTIHAAACDGIRMILVKDEAESLENQEFLLPGHSLQTLAAISTDADIYEVADMGKEIVFVKENMMFTMRKIESSYIDTNSLIKSVKPVYSAVTDAYEMRKVLDLISVGAGVQPVNLVMINGQIHLNCNGESGAVHSVVAAKISTDTPETGFYYNTAKLYKLFQVVDGKVKLEFDSKGTLLVKTRNEVYLQVAQNKPVIKPVGKNNPQDKQQNEAA